MDSTEDLNLDASLSPPKSIPNHTQLHSTSGETNPSSNSSSRHAVAYQDEVEEYAVVPSLERETEADSDSKPMNHLEAGCEDDDVLPINHTAFIPSSPPLMLELLATPGISGLALSENTQRPSNTPTHELMDETLAEDFFIKGQSHHDAGDFLAACNAMEKALMLQRELCAIITRDDSDHEYITSTVGGINRAQGLEKARAMLARYLNQSSFSLQSAGRMEHARLVAIEAVNIQRQLIDRMGSGLSCYQFLLDLVEYVYHLGNTLHTMRHFGEACERKEETLEVWRKLRPATSKDTAPSGDQPGAQLHKADTTRINEKENVNAEGNKDPTMPLLTYRATLAKYYNSLGTSLHELGRFGDACSQKEKAIKIQRKLVQSESNRSVVGAHPEPDVTATVIDRAQQHIIRAALAQYLNSLCTSLHGNKDFVKACKAKGEAVTIQRTLLATNDDTGGADKVDITETDPDVDLDASVHLDVSPDSDSDPSATSVDAEKLKRVTSDRATLAKYLNSLGVSLHQAGVSCSTWDRRRSSEYYKEACKVKREAMCIQRPIRRDNRDVPAHRAALAQYIHSLGTSIHVLGGNRMSAACGYKRQAVELQEVLCSLGTGWSNPRSDLYVSRKPVSVSEEQLSLSSELGRARSLLAQYLNSFGVSLHAAGKVEDACITKERAVQVQRELSNLEARIQGAEDAVISASALEPSNHSQASKVTSESSYHQRALLDYLQSHLQSLRAVRGSNRRSGITKLEREVNRLLSG